MLKVKFWRIGNVVCMKVLEQPEELRLGDGSLIIEKNGLSIFSDGYPNIVDEDSLYIRGDEDQFDNTISCYDFDTEKRAKEYIEKVVNAIDELNKKYKFTPDTSDNDVEVFLT